MLFTRSGVLSYIQNSDRIIICSKAADWSKTEHNPVLNKTEKKLSINQTVFIFICCLSYILIKVYFIKRLLYFVQLWNLRT